MASPATSLQNTQTLPESSAPPASLQVPTLLHPLAAPYLQLYYQHKHAANAPPLPFYLHSGPRSTCAGAMTAGRKTICAQHAVPTAGGDQEGRDGVDQNIARPLHAMFGRAGGNPICRISNPVNRQVTFSKRRNGLFKKAYELSVLCDAELGVIIFSATGRLSEFASSGTSLPKLIERYQEHSNLVPPQENLFRAVEFWRHQVFLLRDQIFHQKNLQSYMLGENLSSVGLNDIQVIEHKIEIAIKKIQVHKAQLMQAKEQESQKQVARLLEENAALKRQLHETTDLHALKEMMLTKNHIQKPPWLDGTAMKSSTYEGSPLAEEQSSPSTASNSISQHLSNRLNLQLKLELFPSKPAE